MKTPRQEEQGALRDGEDSEDDARDGLLEGMGAFHAGEDDGSSTGIDEAHALAPDKGPNPAALGADDLAAEPDEHLNP